MLEVKASRTTTLEKGTRVRLDSTDLPEWVGEVVSVESIGSDRKFDRVKIQFDGMKQTHTVAASDLVLENSKPQCVRTIVAELDAE